MTTLTNGVDNGADTIHTNRVHDARGEMLSSAAAIANAIIGSETKLIETAKTWGHSLFRAVYVDGLNMDGLIGESKMAAGWNTLSANDAGKKAKSRLEVYFSNARTVAEAWLTYDEVQRTDVLDGKSSVHYLATLLRKEAAKAKKVEAAKSAAPAALDVQEDATPGNEAFVSVPFADAAQHFRALLDEASDADILDNGDMLASIMQAIGERYKAMEAATAPEAVAA